ncbi:MAG: hypothetical protein QXZ25_03120 [Candidatus Bathyarchaeia archaeon]
MNSKYATLELELSFIIRKKRPSESIPSFVTYYGEEFVEKAKNNDFSFIKRIPIDQIRREQITIDEDPPWIHIWEPLYIYKKLIVTVDLDTLNLIDENGKWGKWAMWINPLKYPLKGYTHEVFIINWLNTTVEMSVSYNDGTRGDPIETVLGKYEKYFSASTDLEVKFLLEMGLGMSPPLATLHYTYEPRIGILLNACTLTYFDDVLTQKLGVIYTFGEFNLQETNISAEQEKSLDLSSYMPYIATAAILATITGAYIIKKKFIKK